MSRKKLLLIVALAIAVVLFFVFDLERFASLSYIKERQAEFSALYAERPLLVIGAFFLL